MAAEKTLNQSTYSDKLRHPEWFKLRRKVWERENDTCQMCGEKEMEMHVHHKSYEYGKEPWQYPLDNFQLLCLDCHFIVEELKNIVNIYKIYRVQGDGFMHFMALIDSESYKDGVALYKKSGGYLNFSTIITKDYVELILKNINQQWPAKK